MTTEQREYIDSNGGSDFVRDLIEQNRNQVEMQNLDERIEAAILKHIAKLQAAAGAKADIRAITDDTRRNIKTMF